MTLTWEEAEVAALDRSEWRRSVAQCIHLDAGWIKVKVKVNYSRNLHDWHAAVFHTSLWKNFHELQQNLMQEIMAC